jgi:aspartate kinase
MKVLKFGGTSVQNSKAINQVFDIIKNQSEKLVIVVSAMSGITNLLVKAVDYLQINELENSLKTIDEIKIKHLELINDFNLNEDTLNFLNDKIYQLVQLIKALDVLGEVSPKSQDMIFSLGEILSSKIITDYFIAKNLNVNHLDSREVIITDNNFTEANVNFEKSNTKLQNIITNLFDSNDFIIMGGFIAATEQGWTTTLGRGGSDYSAAIIAGAIDADSLEIWTDVDGILTSDPRVIKNVKLLNIVSYEEAAELAYFGAKVLHPKTIFPAIDKNIPVKVLNTFNPDCKGTTIISNQANKNSLKAIAFRKGTNVINIISNRMLGAFGFLKKVFEIFHKYKTSVDIITTSEVSISLTIDDLDNIDNIKEDLSKFAKVEVQTNYAIIAAVGYGVKNQSGLASRFFNVLNDINITMVSIGASEVNMSIVVKEEDVIKAVELLHSEFFTNDLDNEIFSNLG